MTAGVVISLPQPLRERIERIQRACGHPEAGSVPPHITLVTLVPAYDRWEEIAAHLRQVAVASAPFEVGLEGTDSFLPVSPVAYLSVGQGRAELEALAELVRQGPLQVESSFAYVPHITLLYPGTEEEIAAVVRTEENFADSFRVESIGLYQLTAEEGWRLREEIPLGPQHSDASAART